jgi:hypothetical protein
MAKRKRTKGKNNDLQNKHKTKDWVTPLWYLVAIVLSVLLFTDSDYPFGIFKLFLDIVGNQFHQYKNKTNNLIKITTLYLHIILPGLCV